MNNHSSSSNFETSLGKLQRRVRDCYERGMHLMRCDKDYDYAHTMFTECVALEPANLAYVEALLQNLRLKYPRPKKALFQCGGSRELKQAAKSNDWQRVIRVGCELISHDPWDTVTLRTMASACAHFHYNEVELVYLKQALDANPKDLEVNRHCAKSLSRMGQFDQAIACWHRIETMLPGHAEAVQTISQLTAEKQKYPMGRPSLSPTPPAAAAPASTTPKESEPEPAVVSLSPRQKLEQAISNNPQDVSNYAKLAKVLLDAEQFDQAEAVVARGMTACTEDSVLVELLAAVRESRSHHDALVAQSRRKVALPTDHVKRQVPWLETLLALAVFVLIVQLFPAVGTTVRRVIDIRHWSRAGWFIANILVVLLLCSLRFWSTAIDGIRRWRRGQLRDRRSQKAR
jgi:tetratricopeptide (TPR) repeat protein